MYYDWFFQNLEKGWSFLLCQFVFVFIPVLYTVGLQGVPTQMVIFHFALEGRNMQASLGLKMIWES
jgi:hypothetical protein